MTGIPNSGQITIGPFMVDIFNARVFRDGRELKVRRQVFEVLRFMVENPGRLLDYNEMLHEVWDDAPVSKHTVAVTLGELKDLLGEYGYWIKVRQGYGYYFEIPESEHFMRVGQLFRTQFTPSGLDNAIKSFGQATKLVGANPRAWEALAGCYLELGRFCIRLSRDVHSLFLHAYQHAVALEGSTPGLQLNRAVSLYLFERRLAESESELLQVHRARPSLTEVHVHLALVYFLQGRIDDAFVELGKAEKADPLLPFLAFAKPRLLLYRRDIDAAAACAKQAVDLYPNAPLTHFNYADVLDFANEGPEALTEYRIAGTIAPDVAWFGAAEARCLVKQGRSREALGILAQLEWNRKTEYVDAYHLALLLEALGKRDEAFQELERAHSEKSPMLAWLHFDINADTLRTDPRFAELRDRTSSMDQATDI
jgi:tetratricopeptide (TPR) repeat protein